MRMNVVNPNGLVGFCCDGAGKQPHITALTRAISRKLWVTRMVSALRSPVNSAIASRTPTRDGVRRWFPTTLQGVGKQALFVGRIRRRQPFAPLWSVVCAYMHWRICLCFQRKFAPIPAAEHRSWKINLSLRASHHHRLLLAYFSSGGVMGQWRCPLMEHILLDTDGKVAIVHQRKRNLWAAPTV